MAEDTMYNETELDRKETNISTDEAELSSDLEAGFERQLEDEAANADVPDDITALLLENNELKDQNLRLVADMENLRRRTLRDVGDAKIYAVTNFARDMLSVLDNLTRALDAIAPNIRESDSHLNALAEGVEMTSRAMITALEQHGVKKIEAAGAKFDPHFHQAMFEIPNPDEPAGIVAQVVQEGYMLAQRVLRPAMVGITTGGAKDIPEKADQI